MELIYDDGGMGYNWERRRFAGKGNEAALCFPVRLEVLGRARKEERRGLAAGFSVIPYVPVTESTWSLALQNAWRLRDGGVQAPWNDILIASLALEQGCRVYARDEHFDLMQPLIGVQLYQPGYGGSFAPQ
jgi:predicted nucleic acid-binding protein